MRNIDTVVIGAGQAGLALSRCLTERGVEHVVLERGRVAQSWSERWDSLHLLSPNWMTRLPRWQYGGADPDGFMTRDEITAFLQQYASSFHAPVEEETEVLSATQFGSSWLIATDRETWHARNVVIATGHNQQARIPACASRLSRDIVQVSTSTYRNPSQLPDGGVLVIGASASGLQLAREIHASGRKVVLAVGHHTRLPRRYRGRDIHYWLDRTGILRRPLSDMRNPASAQREPSLQLAAGRESLDLGVLARAGVLLAGRITALGGRRVEFAADLASNIADAGRRMDRILGRIDRHINAHGAALRFPAEPRPPAIEVATPPHRLNLAAERIYSVLWATGYKRSYPWLNAPVFDAAGEIVQSRGRTVAPGLYVLGLQFMTRRNSSLIDGVGADAEEIAERIAPAKMQKEAA